MRKALVCIALCLATICPSAAFSQEEEKPRGWTGNANIFIGAKFLESDNWEPVDHPIEGGVLLDVRPKDWWINFAFDFLYARDKDNVDILDVGIGTFSADVESRIMEFDLGMRKVWESPKVIRPFIGCGLAIIQGRIESRTMVGTAADEDTGYGIWADAGLYVTLREHLNIGIDGRWSKVGVHLLDRHAWVGGWHIGAVAGVHW